MTETPLALSSEAWERMIDDLWNANPMSRLLPLSPGEISTALMQVWEDAFKNPTRAWEQYVDFATKSSRLWTNATLKFWGVPAAEPVAQPEAGDRRFSAPDWQRNVAFDAIKQGYLLSATSLLKAAADIQGLDRASQRKLQFYVRQFLDAISPTNSLFTNPRSSTRRLKAVARTW